MVYNIATIKLIFLTSGHLLTQGKIPKKMNKNIIYGLIAIIVIALIGYGIMTTSKTQEAAVLKRELPTPQNLTPIEKKEPVEGMNVPQVGIDLTNSVVRWAAKKTLVTTNNHIGTVQFVNGFVNMEEGTIHGGEFTIDMQSIVNDDLTGASKERLEKHLKSADFFAAEEFPTSEFVITKITPLENSQFMIVGDLTIKGITNEIDFPATITNDENLFLKADLEIDRTLWDIRFGSGKFFENLGDNLIDDIVGLTLEISVPKK